MPRLPLAQALTQSFSHMGEDELYPRSFKLCARHIELLRELGHGNASLGLRDLLDNECCLRGEVAEEEEGGEEEGLAEG